MPQDWKEVIPGNNWNYIEEGKDAEFIGLYRGKEEHVGENDIIVYTFEVKGDFVQVWGSTLLDIRLKNLQFGEEVKIIYLGKEPSKKRKGKFYHNFQVFHRMPEMKEVTT